MDNQKPKYVTRARASYLLGVPMEKLSRILRETDIRPLERAGNKEEWFFTYKELQKICVMATQVSVSAH